MKSVVFVKLASPELCETVVRTFDGKLKFKHNDGNVGEVSVDHAGFGVRTIRIFELPFEITAEQITRVISQYGRVLSHVAERWSTAHKFPVLNGVRQLKVELRRHIPSYVTVCGFRAIVMYDDQPKTCGLCGSAGHMRAQCIQRRVAQLPAGEAARPAVMTTLPVTFSAAARGFSARLAAPDAIETDDVEEAATMMETTVAAEQVQHPVEDGTTMMNTNVVADQVVAGTPKLIVSEEQATATLTPPVNDLAQTRIDSTETLRQNPPKPADQPTPVEHSQKRVSAIQSTVPPATENVPEMDISEESEGSPSQASSPKKRKKRRIARQNAEATAAALREKAQQIAAELKHQEADHSSADRISTQTTVALPPHSDSASTDPNLQRTADPHSGNADAQAAPHHHTDSPTKTVLGNWGEEMENVFNTGEELMDTLPATAVLINTGSQDGVRHERNDVPADTGGQTERPVHPFDNDEYF